MCSSLQIPMSLHQGSLRKEKKKKRKKNWACCEQFGRDFAVFLWPDSSSSIVVFLIQSPSASNSASRSCIESLLGKYLLS